MEKVYSTFIVKSIDTEERVIKGIASTPAMDRDSDIVEPLGAKFSLPFPLLSQHSHDHPVGDVTEAIAKSDGIHITAIVAKNSGLDYVEKTWLKVKANLLRGLSIGFVPIKWTPIKGGGTRFTEYSLFELSLVTVPANVEASITSIKTICTSKDCQNDSVELDIKRANVRKRAVATLAKIKLNKRT